MSFSTTGTVFAKRAPRKQTLSILVCGTSGTGKSSFINTLLGRRVLLDSEQQQHALPAKQEALRFVPTTVQLDEPLSDGSRLVLTLTETEGFGVNINHTDDIEQVAQHIECRFDEVLAEESRIRRNPRFKDNRIDACLYFIEPTGHGLKELDVRTMKRLGSIVNVIPVLARADTLTPSERVANKRLIMEDLRFHDIETFDFQFTDDAAESRVDPEANDVLSALPFALISTSEYSSDGEALFRRVLPFGTAEVLNPQHCDFSLLREAILERFLLELKDRTHDVLYETFRTQRLDPQQNHRASQLLMPQELADHAARLKQAQIDRETALLREEERRVSAEIEAKRAMLLKRERELKELEIRMAQARPLSQPSSAANSQPSSATSTSFPANKFPPHAPAAAETSSPVSGDESHQPSYFPAAVEQASAMEVGAQPRAGAVDGYVDYEVAAEEETELGSASEQAAVQMRVRQVRSKAELKQSASQLHAELGHLEAQRQDIQNKVAHTTSTKSVFSQLTDQGHSSASLADRLGSVSPPMEAPLIEPEGANTSPLNIKKTAAA